MTHENQGQPFQESNLDSPEYRERLLRKLNCLIAVLEVATAKVRRTMEGPGADVERLARIRQNLQDTLDVCQRAKVALESRGKLPEGIAGELTQVIHPEALQAETLARQEALQAKASSRPRGPEWSSLGEQRKFKRLEPIQRARIASVDFDELGRLLQA